jgi:hypothetical protein
MPKYVNNIAAESGGEMAVCLTLNGVFCWVIGIKKDTEQI